MATQQLQPQQIPLFDESAEPTLDATLAEVMAHLGITGEIPYERREIAIAHIRIPHEQRVRGVGRYTRNIRVAGTLHDPAVVPIADTDEYEAVFGRHRICGNRDAGKQVLWVRVYASLNPRVKAFLRLSEQRRRATNWIDEFEEVMEVIEEGSGLSERAMAFSLGVPRPTLRFYFRLAKLPFMVRERILVGEVTATTARQMLRLDAEQLVTLEQYAAGDEPLDAGVVKRLLHQRISAGLIQVPLVVDVVAPDAPGLTLDQRVLADAARQLMRSLDLFLPQLNGATLGESARVRVAGQIFAQELARLAYQPIGEPMGGAA